jgi:hypothetical protein
MVITINTEKLKESLEEIKRRDKLSMTIPVERIGQIRARSIARSEEEKGNRWCIAQKKCGATC